MTNGRTTLPMACSCGPERAHDEKMARGVVSEALGIGVDSPHYVSHLLTSLEHHFTTSFWVDKIVSDMWFGITVSTSFVDPNADSIYIEADTVECGLTHIWLYVNANCERNEDYE